VRARVGIKARQGSTCGLAGDSDAGDAGWPGVGEASVAESTHVAAGNYACGVRRAMRQCQRNETRGSHDYALACGSEPIALGDSHDVQVRYLP
jgi:hypothetical protein